MIETARNRTGSVALGAMTFGAQVDEVEASRMVAACRDAGITMFDTSNNYAGGRSEEILGRLVRPFRDEILLATKGGSPVGQRADALPGLSRSAVTKSVDDSLRRLATDRIDVYYLHRPDRNTPVAETLETLADLVAEGKIRSYGQSNFAAWQVTEMIYLCRANGWPEPLISQQVYNLLARRIEAEYEECAVNFGLFSITYNPLAGGLLSGKHRREVPAAPDSRFTKEYYRTRYWNKVHFVAVERLRTIAADAGLSLVQLAYRWVLSRELTDAVLIGASSLDQLRVNLDAVGGPALSEEVLAACDAVWVDLLHGAAVAYNR